MPGQTLLYGQIGTDRTQIVPLSQLTFLTGQDEIALVAGNRPLTLDQVQTRTSQVSPNAILFCQVSQEPAKALLGFHQDDQGRLVLQ
ncbi:hypothetical protein SAMN05660469_0582 [Fructobacillus pseudoficulneus]|nr:hypothetical protein SAMN05660469_0582 [Fructobacillus pseudoficulneus]